MRKILLAVLFGISVHAYGQMNCSGGCGGSVSIPLDEIPYGTGTGLTSGSDLVKTTYPVMGTVRTVTGSTTDATSYNQVQVAAVDVTHAYVVWQDNVSVLNIS